MNNFPIPKKNILLIIIGVVLLIIGYILMAGGKAESPEVFSYEIFNFRRLVLAPIVIILGFVFEIFAILYRGKKSTNNE
jgi:membrane-bound ClpP family serine protease